MREETLKALDEQRRIVAYLVACTLTGCLAIDRRRETLFESLLSQSSGG
jgi:hypothetical protein